MNLSEDEIIQKYAKIADIAIGTLYYHMNMNLLVSHADIMSINANMNYQKYNVRK